MPASPQSTATDSLDFAGHWAEFEEVARRRRSVRKYTDRPIAEKDMNDILDMGLLAPNSSNLQPFELYWVRSPQKKKQLVEACLSQNAAKTAQELVVCVARWDQWNECRKEYVQWLRGETGIPKPVMLYYERLAQTMYNQGPLGVYGAMRKATVTATGLFRPMPRAPMSDEDMRVWAVKSAALCCENIMLAAAAKGFDSCPMEGMDAVRVAKIVGVSGSKWDIPMVLGFGYRSDRGLWGRQWRRERSKLVREL